MTVRLKNEKGIIVESKVGFSWTTLFFGFFVPLFRRDFKMFAIMALICIISYKFSIFNWCMLIFPFFYNKMYIKDLLNKGYEPYSDVDYQILVSKGFLE